MAERPEDLNLPNAVITRIIKDALPEGVNVSKDARLAMSKAASVFVLYATSCANNFAMKAKRKTISGPDVIAAMSDMEFDRFTEPLKAVLEAFKKEQKTKKDAAEARKKAKTDNDTSTGDAEAVQEEEEEEVEEEEEDNEEEGNDDGDDDGQSVEVIEDEDENEEDIEN